MEATDGWRGGSHPDEAAQLHAEEQVEGNAGVGRLGGDGFARLEQLLQPLDVGGQEGAGWIQLSSRSTIRCIASCLLIFWRRLSGRMSVQTSSM